MIKKAISNRVNPELEREQKQLEKGSQIRLSLNVPRQSYLQFKSQITLSGENIKDKVNEWIHKYINGKIS